MKQFLTIVETATELVEEQGRKMEMDEQNHGHHGPDVLGDAGEFKNVSSD